MLSRSYLSRIPDQTMLLDVPEIPPLDTSEHGNVVRAAHPRTTRCAAGSYGMVYFPQAHQSLEVDVRRLAGRVNAWWYDPRTGTSHAAGVTSSGTGRVYLAPGRAGLGIGAGRCNTGLCATRHPLPTACTGHYGCSEQVPAPTQERSEWVSETFDGGRITTITTIVPDA